MRLVPNKIHFQYSYICISNNKFLPCDHIKISVTYVLGNIAGENFAVSTFGELNLLRLEIICFGLDGKGRDINESARHT